MGIAGFATVDEPEADADLHAAGVATEIFLVCWVVGRRRRRRRRMIERLVVVVVVVFTR